MSTRWLETVAVLWVMCAAAAADTGYMQLRGAVHVHSDFSSGQESIETIARRALKHDLDVVVMGDDDLLAVEYGVPLLRRLLRFRRTERSLLTQGTLDAYLEEIRRVDALYPDLILIDGVESAPFYYWEVDWRRMRWTLRNWNKHLLAVGLNSAKVYADLPVSGSQAIWRWSPAGLLLLWPLLGLAYGWLARRRHPGWIRYPVIVVSVLCLANNIPLQMPLWDAYSGDLGAAPYQAYIDYVRQHGGLVFWAHPESRSTLEPMQALGGRVQIVSHTPAHAGDLLATRRYTGFAALYADNITATEPGQEWDQLLEEYVQGQRQEPVWGTGDIDYHFDDVDRRNQLHDIQTVFLVRERSRAAVLDAMRSGRMYAARGGDQMLMLEEFRVSAAGVGRQAGQTLQASGGRVHVELRLVHHAGLTVPVELRLVKGGRVAATMTAETPCRFRYIDTSPEPGERTWYRILAWSQTARLTSNPVFVEGSER